MSLLLQSLLKKDMPAAALIMGMRIAMIGGKFILALFIARMMGLDTLGLYGLIVGFAAVGQVVARTGIFSSLARQAAYQQREELCRSLYHYGAGLVLLYSVALAVFAAAGAVSGYFVLALLIVLVIAAEHISYDIFLLTNNLQRALLANSLLFIQSAGWIFLYMGLALVFPALLTLNALLLFWIGGSVLILALALFLTRAWPWAQARRVPLQPSWYIQKFKESVSLYCSETVNMIAQYIDRYIITLTLGLELTGIYVLFWQVTNAIANLIGAGVLQVFRPRLIIAHRDGDAPAFLKHARESAIKTFATGAGLCIAAGVIVPFLIPLAKEPAAMHYLPLLWVMLAGVLLRLGSDVLRNILYSRHQDRQLLMTNIIALAVSVPALLLFMHAFGIYGAAYAGMTAMLAVGLYGYWVYIRGRQGLA